MRLAVLAFAPLLIAAAASAGSFTDATGRSVTIPDAPARVFAAGPPASVMPELARLAGPGGTEVSE